jgi:YrbI family 3-deoxy-D-manno-octulosonate 8-phosphate phosphatase
MSGADLPPGPPSGAPSAPGCVAVIPARGGSKGIPGKNLLPLGGVPLVARAVAAARAASTVSRVIVSTDDAAIAEVARRAGAEVVDRPHDLAGDRASSESALLHTLDVLEQAEGAVPEILAFLQCTSPLIEPGDIDGTVTLVAAGEHDSALTVAPNHRFLWRRTRSGAAGVNHDPVQRLPRQELEPEFVETGAVYAMRVDGFRASGHRFFGSIGLHEVPTARSFELDDPDDVVVAQALVGTGAAAERRRLLPTRVEAIICDFDGVLTDNRVEVSEDGTESVTCDRGDGFGIEMVRRAGVQVAVISKERNPVVSARCRKLQVHCIQGIDDKVPALLGWLGEVGIDPADAVFVGNDLNDLECMGAVGAGVAVADAVREVRAQATIVLERNGGQGAVRELCDLVLQNRGAS